MPIYEYRCCDCNQVFEEWQKDFENRDIPCPSCGGKSERLISNTSFILKGGGWYVTDYSRGSSQASSASSPDKPAGGNGSESKNNGSKDAAAKDAPKAEAKPAAPKAAKDTATSKAS